MYIWHAAKFSTSTREGPHHYREYTELDQGYHAILGSVNGASTMRMLLDHKAQLRAVAKITRRRRFFGRTVVYNKPGGLA